MKRLPTDLPDVWLLEPERFTDERGWFMESFSERTFAALCRQHGIVPPVFVQDNHSCSHAGVLRGLHFQRAPYAQGKLVRVVSGSAWDVAVDVRPDSPTFGRWTAAELSAENARQLWLPAGFAHGFLALSDNTQVLYKTTAFYCPQSEVAIRWDDADLAVAWPLNAVARVVVGAKDEKAQAWSALF